MSPKINVYLPDDLAAEVKASGIPVSAVCQQALADAVAQAMTGWSAPSGSAGGDDLARSFTKRASAVVSAARDAAEEPTSVELMAALVESGGLAVTVLTAADLDPQDVVDELRGRQKSGGTADALDEVAALAVEQARGLGHPYVGTEHLLLAMTGGPTRELARTTLHDMGLSHEDALRGVATALSAYTYARETLTFSGLSAPIRAALEDIRARLGRLEERGISAS
ncbi:MAG TPA: Clp protease N-terminal domain-containing protein [Nocardioides sp.]|jgi:ATP-dependent Clp protease ATP-binding subunit ClpA|nr:Clp protease N-terminal domain-containing protein [Nocardioides sp.]